MLTTDDPAIGEPTAPTPVPTGRAEPERSWRRYWLLLLLPLLVGGALRVLAGTTDDVVTTDASAYLRSGESIWSGDGFNRDGRPELHFPPVTPTLLGGATDLLGDPLTGSVVVTIVTGTLLLIPLAGIARLIGGDRAGLAAAWLGALCPALLTIPANQGGGSEGPFLLLVLGALWAGLAVAGRTDRWLYGGAAAAGLGVGLAFLTRPEGLLYTAVLVPLLAGGAVGGWAAVRRRRPVPGGIGRAGLATLAFGVAMAVCVVPYVDYLHTNTGRWELTAKTRDASLDAWRAVADNDRRARDEVFYELQDDGTSFVAGRHTLAELVRADPTGYLGIVGINVRTLASQVLGPDYHPYPTWELVPLPLTALALWAAWRARRRRGVIVVLAAGVVALAVPLGFFVQPRYLTPISALLCILAGLGLTLLPARWRRPTGVLVVVSLVLSLYVGFGGPRAFLAPREQIEHRIAGEWLDANAAADARVMTRNLVVDFYADRQMVPMPYSSLSRMIEFARDTGTDYIVADQYQLARQRPQFLPLFKAGPWPGLRLVHEFVAAGRLTRIFTLDPPAPAGAEQELPEDVGFVGDEG